MGVTEDFKITLKNHKLHCEIIIIVRVKILGLYPKMSLYIRNNNFCSLPIKYDAYMGIKFFARETKLKTGNAFQSASKVSKLRKDCDGS